MQHTADHLKSYCRHKLKITLISKAYDCKNWSTSMTTCVTLKTCFFMILCSRAITSEGSRYSSGHRWRLCLRFVNRILTFTLRVRTSIRGVSDIYANFIILMIRISSNNFKQIKTLWEASQYLKYSSINYFHRWRKSSSRWSRQTSSKDVRQCLKVR